MKGIGLHPAKQGSDGKTSHFADIRTNLFPSYSLTHAEGGMEPHGSELFYH